MAQIGSLSGPARDQTSLARIMDRIVSRDERALSALQRAIGRDVYWTVLPIVRRPSMAEEVMADCFWQIWTQADRYAVERGSVKAWAASIARSRAIDFVRRNERISRHEGLIDDELGPEPSSSDEQAHEERLEFDALRSDFSFEDDDRDACVRKLLDASAPAHRQMLSLAFYAGMSHIEIAAHCGLPLGTVKSHLRRGLAALKPLCLDAGLSNT